MAILRTLHLYYNPTGRRRKHILHRGSGVPKSRPGSLWNLGSLQEWLDRRVVMNNGLIKPEIEAVGEVEMINYVDFTENDSTPGCEQVMLQFSDMGSGSTLDVISNANRRYHIDYDHRRAA